MVGPLTQTGAVPRFNLPLRRLQGQQDRRGIGDQIAVYSQRVQIRQRTPDIAGNDREQRFRRRREESDVETLVQEECRDIGAIKDVL